MMQKVGRFTAAAVLVALGGLLLHGQLTGIDWTGWVMLWWPAAIILLGVEVLVFAVLTKPEGVRRRLDVAGLAIAFVISIAVLSAMHGLTWAKGGESWRGALQWLNVWESTAGDYGHTFPKDKATLSIDASVERVRVDHPNGHVTVAAGLVRSIEVEPTVIVDRISEEEARSIAERTEVAAETNGNELVIRVNSPTYSAGLFGQDRKPRVNLKLTVPEDRKADWDFELASGKLEATGLPLANELNAATVNGSVTVKQVEGRVKAETQNGKVLLDGVRGDASGKTINGSVTAVSIAGRAELKTTNGSIHAERIGTLSTHAVNDEIVIADPLGDVEADTTNGRIEAKAGSVGGDWTLKTVNGAIDIRIPETASVRVEASSRNGKPDTDLPLETGRRDIRGTLGEGRYLIKAESTNSGISVRKPE